jgi:hypothetical protein
VAAGLPGWSVTVVVAALAVSTVALVPALILGYGVRAAERDDRNAGRVAPAPKPRPSRRGQRGRRPGP